MYLRQLCVVFSSILNCRWYHCLFLRKKNFLSWIFFSFFSSFIQYLLLPKQGIVKTKKLQFLSPREAPLPSFFPLPSSLDSKAKKMLLCTLFIGGCLVHHNLILYDQYIFWDTLVFSSCQIIFCPGSYLSLCQSSYYIEPNHSLNT